MKRRLVLAFILGLALAVAIAAGFASHSSATPKSGAAIIPLVRVGITSASSNGFSSLDPTKSNNFSPFPIFERLMGLNSDGKLYGVLATSVSQPGPAVYVYHLRHGVKFWDGNEMTATDVANALNYERAPTSQNAGLFGPVKTITAKDKYTVVVTLKHRDASWKYVPSFVGFIFEKKFQDAHKTTMGQPGVLIQGTGAWQVDSFDPTAGVELSANPHWWGGTVPIRHISFKFFSDEVSMALAFRGAAIDLATPTNAQAFASTAGTKLSSAPAQWNPGFISMAVNSPHWSDVHVRRAVAYALNRKDIIAASGAPGTPLSTSTSVIMPGQLRVLGSKAEVDALLKSLPQYPYNLAKAKAEMAKSAYPNGFDASTNTTTFGAYVQIHQVIAAQLKQIGINLTVNVVPGSAWVSGLLGDKSKLGFTFFTDGPFPNPDPNTYLSQLFGAKNINGGFNTSAYAPPGFDNLLNLGVTTLAPAKRLAIYGQVLKRLDADVPMIPVYLADSNLALSSKLAWPTWAGATLTGALPSDWAVAIKAK